jgi:uncharacterized protein (UPF0303 family)
MPRQFRLAFVRDEPKLLRMSLDQDLARIAEQEKALQFERFDARTAWEIGGLLRQAAEKRGASLALDITLSDQPVFFHLMAGATPNNASWIRRKKNTVLHFHRSSYGVGLQLERDRTDLTSKFGLSLSDYAVHGGGFPLTLQGTGVIGAITVSGLPQRDDHSLVVEVLATFLGRAPADLALV